MLKGLAFCRYVIIVFPLRQFSLLQKHRSVGIFYNFAALPAGLSNVFPTQLKNMKFNKRK